MPLTPDSIIRVAHLARLALDPLQAGQALQAGVTGIMTMVDQIQAVNTDGIEPMAHPFDAPQRLRSDTVTEPEQEAALAQRAAYLQLAPQTEAGLYLVSKVIE